MSDKWQWWWKDKREMKIWNKLNSIPPEKRSTSKYTDLIDEKIRLYGNIYFFKPLSQCEAFMSDESLIKVLHGNNGSGKSYQAGADFCYEFMGWSPYREVRPIQFGQKVMWAFSPTQKTQRESSQVVLFAIGDKATQRDIGLLPKLEDIEILGGKVVWEDKRKRILDNVEFPDGTVMYFKTMEMSLLSISAAAVDTTWYDELPPQSKFDEGVTRVIRKDGSVIMSCLVESAEDSYLVQDFYTRYEDDIKNNIHTDFSFHFITIEGNTELKIADLESRKRNISTQGSEWRFSKEGRFNVNPKGTRVWGSFHYDPHALFPDLLTSYDPMKAIVLFWDLGRYAVIGLQSDDWGNINYLFSIYRKDVQLSDMIEIVDQYIDENVNDVIGELHVIPHDANRQTKLTRVPTSTRKIMEEEYHKQVKVIYIDAESSIQTGNTLLKRMDESGKPKLKFDPQNCSDLINALNLHVRNDNGKPKEGPKIKDFTDAFKLSISFIEKYRKRGTIVDIQGRQTVPLSVMKDSHIRYGRIFGHRRVF